MTRMEKVTLTTFTDPMMGLSYEQEPVYNKLAEVFGENLEFRYVMAGLVRDVSDFMTQEERSLPAEEGIRRYNRRLAQIYKSEESIGNLPMNMEGFHLFDVEHRSSYPLCIAYKAAQLTDAAKVDDYLLRVRHATVLECRQTTKRDVLAEIAEEAGIDRGHFLEQFDGGSAERAFREDLRLTRSLGIRGLPACMIQGKVMVNGLSGYQVLRDLIVREMDETGNT